VAAGFIAGAFSFDSFLCKKAKAATARITSEPAINASGDTDEDGFFSSFGIVKIIRSATLLTQLLC